MQRQFRENFRPRHCALGFFQDITGEVIADLIGKRLADGVANATVKAGLERVSLETGLRASNAALLRWDQVDMQNHCAWAYADESKSGHAIGIPLSERAIEVIKEQLGQLARSGRDAGGGAAGTRQLE